MDDSNSIYQALLSTIKEGDYNELEDLLELEGLDSQDARNNCLALIHAIKANNIDGVKLLLDYGCTINQSSEVDLFYAPLHYAIEVDSLQMIEMLLDAGASIVTKSSAKTPLYKAMRKQRYDIVDLMLSKYNVKKIDPSNKQEFVHFCIACIRNNENLVEQFIKKGIDVNGVLDDYAEEWAGYTPLYLSVKYLSVEVVEILLKHKADFTFQDKNGNSPLHVAYYSWKNKNIKTCRKEKAKEIIDLILLAHRQNINDYVNVEGLSYFHIACTGCNATLVYYFLQSGVNVNSPVFMDPQISTAKIPLHLAVECNRTNIVKVLLQHKADIAAKNSKGQTSLQMAVDNKFYKVAELLLDFNALASAEDKECYDLIFQAFSDYRVTGKVIDKMFLACQENIVNSVNENGLSLLHIACTQNNIDTVNKLLLTTPDVNVCVHDEMSQWNGYTALHFAASVQNLDAVHTLLQHQANVNVVEGRGLTPIWLSIQAHPKYTKIEKMINKKFAENEEEHADEEQIIDTVYFESKQIQVVELLAQNKSNLNHRNNADESLLFGTYQSYLNIFINKRGNSTITSEEVIFSKIYIKYIQKSVEKVMKCLIEHDIDLNVFDDENNHILHYVIRSMKIDQCIDLAMSVAEILLKNGVDVNVCNNDGDTPLHVAAQLELSTLVELLLKYGANSEAVNKQFMTPLLSAMTSSNRNFYGFVLQPNRTNYLKNEPEISGEFLKMIECLLKLNCNVNARDTRGQTAIFIAAANKDSECLKLLLAYGADINVKNNEGLSVLEKISKYCELSPRFETNSCFQILDILLWHSLKLLMIGESVDPCNLLRCERNADKFKFYYRKVYMCTEDQNNDLRIPQRHTASLREELEKLKDARIDNYTTLYDVLRKDIHQMTKHVKNKILEEYVRSESLGTQFPYYGWMLKLKFRDGLIRNDILDEAVESFQCLATKKLPLDCLDRILSYITNNDMNNLIIASSL